MNREVTHDHRDRFRAGANVSKSDNCQTLDGLPSPENSRVRTVVTRFMRDVTGEELKNYIFNLAPAADFDPLSEKTLGSSKEAA